jgi:hypothetical protein
MTGMFNKLFGNDKIIEVDLYEYKLNTNERLPGYAIPYLVHICRLYRERLWRENPERLLIVEKELLSISDAVHKLNKEELKQRLQEYIDEFTDISDLAKCLTLEANDEFEEINYSIIKIATFILLYASYNEFKRFTPIASESYIRSAQDHIERVEVSKRENYEKYAFPQLLVDAYKEYLSYNSMFTANDLPSPEEFRRMETDVFNFDIAIRGDLVFLNSDYLIVCRGKRIVRDEDFAKYGMEPKDYECHSYGVYLRKSDEFGIIDIVIGDYPDKVFCYKTDRNFKITGEQINKYLNGVVYIKKL